MMSLTEIAKGIYAVYFRDDKGIAHLITIQGLDGPINPNAWCQPDPTVKLDQPGETV